MGKCSQLLCHMHPLKNWFIRLPWRDVEQKSGGRARGGMKSHSAEKFDLDCGTREKFDPVPWPRRTTLSLL
jgi:hypothetical protein